MSVYQVEEYYVSIEVPKDKVEAVKELLNSEDFGYVCADSHWDGNSLYIDNFDCESYAEDADDQIMQVIES